VPGAQTAAKNEHGLRSSFICPFLNLASASSKRKEISFLLAGLLSKRENLQLKEKIKQTKKKVEHLDFQAG